MNGLQNTILYLNNWEYKNNRLVKLIFKHNVNAIVELLQQYSWIRFSHDYKCYYFIRSKANLELFYSIFSEKLIINDWYLNKPSEKLRIENVMVTNTSNESQFEIPKKKLTQQIHVMPIGIDGYRQCVCLKFKYNKMLSYSISMVNGVSWDKSLRLFIMKRNTVNLKELLNNLKPIARISISKELTIKDTEIMQMLFEQSYDIAGEMLCPKEYIEKLSAKNYSKSTIQNYHKHFSEYVFYFKDTDLNSITKEQIEDYIKVLTNTRDVSVEYIHMSINAIKYYYEKVLNNKRVNYDIDRPKKAFRLPNVMSEQEVQHILKQTTNIKHKCILLLLYSAGLRIGEIINLKIGDIQKDRNMIFVKGAKGKKDRYTILSDKIRQYLRDYYKGISRNSVLLKNKDNEQDARFDFARIAMLFLEIITQSDCLLSLFPKGFYSIPYPASNFLALSR